eukprot:TRINITY_DN2228_c0_g1_i1.p3 TRINITY_DN2228_c0_g1~~TRINITY_DN2228_c0_g1_i1.p3  ORF type:complete len:124 (-),score=19.28 TRINITY_DN2228_c0_g1_i1:1025-1396(-)
MCIRDRYQRRVHGQEDQQDQPAKEVYWHNDLGNLILLSVLYTVQGIVIGWTITIGILLISGGAKYSDLAILSFAQYPWILKILWAPFQDAYYFKNFGKRKTYIVPTMYFFGIVFIALSFQMEE